jgi:hypothetical protein
MTQIKLLVIMPLPEDQQADDASRDASGASPDASFTDQVNAILRFDDGWRLTMSGTEYPRGTAEGTKLAGDAGEPPVKEAIASLAEAAAEPDSEAGTAADGDAEGIEGIKAQAEVLQFEVPEGRTSIQVRVEPEAFVEDGEQHVRVKVSDPRWVKDTGSKDAGPKQAGSKDAGPKQAGSKDDGPKEAGSKEAGSKDRGPKEAGSKDDGPKKAGSPE